jgi:hypothetical protein
MISLSCHSALPCFLAVAFTIGGAPADLRADAKASGGTITLLHDEPGHAGGQVSGGLVTAETSTGGVIAGGVTATNPVAIQDKGGYTGQLYDVRSIAISALPGTTLNEGDAVRLAANLSLDDGTTMTGVSLAWSVMSGPVTLGDGDLAIAGAVTENETAFIGASFAGETSSLRLDIVNLPFQGNSLSWEPAASEEGPYRVWFGTQPSSLSLVSTETSPHYNPGQLEMGRTYYYQIFDSQNNDVTPGGRGPQTFRTALFRPDIRIGKKGRVSTHRGNNIYNTNGKGQTLKISLTGKRKSKIYFSVENDGDSMDHHTVRGSKARKKLKSLRYFRLTMGRVNVTASAIRLGFTQPRVNPGGVFIYQIQAKSRGTRARQNVNLIARSVSDSRAIDIGRAKLKTVVKKLP